MKFFAAAILAATAFAIKQEQRGGQRPATGEDRQRGALRILEAIDSDNSGEIDSWEAYEAGVWMRDAGIMSEEDFAGFEQEWPEEPVDIEDAAMWLQYGIDSGEIPADEFDRVVRQIEDEALMQFGAEMWEDLLYNFDGDFDGQLSLTEVEAGIEMALEWDLIDEDRARDVRDFARYNAGDDGKVSAEEAFSGLAEVIENDPAAREELLGEVFEAIEEEQQMWADWEEYEETGYWEDDYEY